MKFVAFTYPGLESILKSELEQRKIEVNKVEDGLITFSGDTSTLVKTNLWLRTASKVYVLLWEHQNITDFNTLFDVIYSINWQDLIPKWYQIVINPDSIRSTLTATPTIQAISQKAIIKKISWDKHYNVEEWKKVEIRINLFKNTLKIMLNTTWESLYKRWYKVWTSPAQLKETLAAGIILLSKAKNKVCYDPFCGSGTILIEKAMIDLHIAPGLFRNFAFENFDWVDKNILEKEKRRAKTRQKEKNLEFIGTDIDSHILEIAQNNAISAGVDKYIKFYKEDFSKAKQKKDCDIITNPPYNKRLQIDNIENIYNKLNNELAQDSVHGGIITWYDEFKHSVDNKLKMRVFTNWWEKVKFYWK